MYVYICILFKVVNNVEINNLYTIFTLIDNLLFKLRISSNKFLNFQQEQKNLQMQTLLKV